MRIFTHLVGPLGALALSSPALALPPYQGLYVVGNVVGANFYTPLDPSIYANPNIDGIVVKANWDGIEPSEGSYTWTRFDQAVTAAQTAGKRIALDIIAGVHSSPWVASLTSFSAPTSANPQVCEAETVPIPWDPTYQVQYSAMIHAVATHMASLGVQPVAVRLGGEQDQSDEDWLSNSATVPANCDTATVQWAALGYTPVRAIAAWQSLAAATVDAFPNAVYVSVMRGAGAGYPAISNAGVVLKGPKSRGFVDVQLAINSLGVATYGPAFGAMFDAVGLQSTNPVWSEAQAVAAAGGIAFYQLNLDGGVALGSGCGGGQVKKGQPFVPCTDGVGGTYEALLQSAVDTGGYYIEIWPANAVSDPVAIAAIHPEL